MQGKTVGAPPKGAQYCDRCGTVAVPKRFEYEGSGALELLLWICLLIPGLFYTIWRLQHKRAICPKCGRAEMIPADSPRAVAAIRQARATP
jgi:ribosomal protein S27AE